jgi:peptidoglycan/LPS O-acetylase OafA/YrhL
MTSSQQNSSATLPAPTHEDEFFASLHGLRGVAVLYVLVSHLGNAKLFLLPFDHSAIGKVGVWIFFSLSAYLLTDRLMSKLRRDGGRALTAYAIHRIARIYPLFVVVVAIHWAIGHLSPMQSIRHLALIEARGELWAISTEFQYYLAIPIVAWIAVASRKAAIAALIASLAFATIYAFRHQGDVFSNGFFVLPKLAPFLMASLLAVWRPTIANANAIGIASFALLVAATAAYQRLTLGALDGASAPWISLALSIAACGLIHAATAPGMVATLLSVRPLVWVGKISFSLYLLHMFAIDAFLALKLDSTLSAWLAAIVAIAVSGLSYRLIEYPGIRFGVALGKRLEAATRKPSPA